MIFPAGVFISLGSNLGDREKNLREAIGRIGALDNTRLEKISGIYSTTAWGKTDQDDFLNAVIEIHTTFSAEALMENLLRFEIEMGRIREAKWGPRLIDMDILFYGDKIHRSEKLIIPHPELQNRKFVLVPLAEIAPGFIHPVSGKAIVDILKTCEDTLAVIPVAPQISAHA